MVLFFQKRRWVFDQFMNIVLDESIEEVSAAESNAIGMVVIRGNSVVQFECLDRL